MTTTWDKAKADLLWALRDDYNEEIGRVAEELRPRFQAGELHAYRSADDGEAERRLEAEVRRRFGLEVTEEPGDGFTRIRADDATAHGILAVSRFTDETADPGWHHEAHHAVCSAAWDVVMVARQRGWYTPTADEVTHPGHRPSCPYGCKAA